MKEDIQKHLHLLSNVDDSCLPDSLDVKLLFLGVEPGLILLLLHQLLHGLLLHHHCPLLHHLHLQAVGRPIEGSHQLDVVERLHLLSLLLLLHLPVLELRLTTKKYQLPKFSSHLEHCAAATKFASNFCELQTVNEISISQASRMYFFTGHTYFYITSNHISSTFVCTVS